MIVGDGMRNDNFINWLIEVKKYQKKTAHDIESRVNRVRKIVNNTDIKDDNMISALQQKEKYINLSSSVRCQLKKAMKLFNEYNT